MRYYDITLKNAKTGEIIRPKPFKSLNLPSTYTSFVKGKTLPGALDIEIQATATNFAQPLQGSFVRIWGVSLEEISQAQNLNGCLITVKAGMQKGLPLAKPNQSGVILTGEVFQAFGNWEGIDKTLDLIMYPTSTKPLNFQFSWKKNSPLSDAIRTTLATAMPDYEIKIAISNDLVMKGDMAAINDKVEDFAKMINNVTRLPQFKGIKTQGGGDYQGVNITTKDKTVIVSDGTSSEANSTNSLDNPKKIAFEDIIGQPTWINQVQINIKLVMRGDLGVGDFIQLPDKLNTPYILTAPSAAVPNAPSRDKLGFKGKFQIQKVFFFGRYRATGADSWVTVLDLLYIPGPSSEGSNKDALIAKAFDAPTGQTVNA